MRTSASLHTSIWSSRYAATVKKLHCHCADAQVHILCLQKVAAYSLPWQSYHGEHHLCPADPLPRIAWHGTLTALEQRHSPQHMSEALICVQESERMYPVAGGTVRMPKKDVVVGGQYVIPKDVTVFLPVSTSAQH